ncbi:hypothetical protein CERSUDRAFT_75388 [Gelatoporia subvermispora B]|uniref:Uncharacterized protein n=1 Tax=Ceriporiopsis subvermispora (strain B) TaxID=914234 RepID=M2R8Q0_CERS8|nr:hypothetical protein CERSUDRAFT_75388 [Gelatoporia subvermispora B]
MVGALLTAKLQRIKRVEFEPRERNIHAILGSRMWIPRAYSNTCQTGTGSTNTCHVQPLQDVQTTTPEPGDFEEGLLPYALELVGAQPPWTYLSKGDVQGLRECGFTRGNYPVLNIDSTCAYLTKATIRWQTHLGEVALGAVKTMIHAAKLCDHEEIATFIQNLLGDPDNDAPFHWKIWNASDPSSRSGYFRHELVLRTFVVHIESTENIPDQHKVQDRPIGALILSLLAVERALSFWRTGELIIPPDPLDGFTVNNWGDAVRPIQGVPTLIPRASRFVDAAKQLERTDWEDIYHDVHGYCTDTAAVGKHRVDFDAFYLPFEACWRLHRPVARQKGVKVAPKNQKGRQCQIRHGALRCVRPGVQLSRVRLRIRHEHDFGDSTCYEVGRTVDSASEFQAVLNGGELLGLGEDVVGNDINACAEQASRGV